MCANIIILPAKRKTSINRPNISGHQLMIIRLCALNRQIHWQRKIIVNIYWSNEFVSNMVLWMKRSPEIMWNGIRKLRRNAEWIYIEREREKKWPETNTIRVKIRPIADQLSKFANQPKNHRNILMRLLYIT